MAGGVILAAYAVGINESTGHEIACRWIAALFTVRAALLLWRRLRHPKVRAHMEHEFGLIREVGTAH